MCVFNGGTRFQSFWSQSLARKDISCNARNPMLDKIVFRQSRFFFTFFLQHVSLTLFHLCPCRFWKVLLALILGGTVVWLFLLRNFGIIINNFIFHLVCKLIIMQFFKKIFYVTKSTF